MVNLQSFEHRIYQSAKKKINSRINNNFCLEILYKVVKRNKEKLSLCAFLLIIIFLIMKKIMR